VSATQDLAAIDQRYARFVALGCHKPSGSPEKLSYLRSDAVPAACGRDFSGVGCVKGRCALLEADCAWEGQTRGTCEASGGRWGGCTEGRGRLPGCNPKTGDGGKACTDSAQCEGVCVHGLCSAFLRFKGCGVQRGGQVLCVE
jgi:hypothetical protein